MKTFTVLLLCLVGCVAKKKDGEKVGKSMFSYDYDECEGGDGACGYCSSTCDSDNGCSIVPAGADCTYHKDCKKGLYCDGAVTIGCGGTCKAGTKKDGERVEQDRPFHYDYDQCVGGDGSCGYCSSTCDSDKGCSIVPHRGPCVHDNDCQEGLYCDGGKNSITIDCGGVCLAKCQGFNQKDQRDLCKGIEALDFAWAAYTYADHYCCQDGGNFKFSEKQCAGDTEVKREDCLKDPACKAGCAKMYGESHNPEDISLEEWNSNVGQLLDLKRHTAHLDSKVNKIKGDPFGFTSYVGYAIVVGFKGSESPGDFAADADFDQTDFVVQDPHSEKFKYRAHEGFVRYYSAIRESVLEEVDRLMEVVYLNNGRQAKELVLSGHSLGGAMATLCAVEMATKYPDIKVNLWTYGCPRTFVGNTKSAEKEEHAYNAHVLLTTNGNTNHRYMADGDPVPSLNLESFGFMHCGEGLELYKGGHGKCKHCGLDDCVYIGGVSSHFKDNYHKLMVEDGPKKCGTRVPAGFWMSPEALEKNEL